MSKRVTQSDVARLAGVSRPTVSRVLNNRLGEAVPITQATRQRILDAAETLGYQPHAGALSLRSGRSNTIGLLLPDAFNPHHLAALRGVEAVAREHDYQLQLTVSNQELEQELRGLRALAQQRIDGLILGPAFAGMITHELQALRLQGDPIVGLGNLLPDCDSIIDDYAGGAAEMMQYLLGLGHRHIGFIWGVSSPAAGHERVTAYRQALAGAGLPVDEALIVRCGPRLEDGVQAANLLLAQIPRPTALLGVNDLMAIGAMEAAACRGLSVPGDLSVAGFDDIDMAGHLVPPLTTVQADGEALGREAVRLLLHRLSDPDLPRQHVIWETHLIIRGSTGPCRQVPIRCDP